MVSIVVTAIAFAAAYIGSALVLPVILRVATERQLFDFPDFDRRGHRLPTPRLGGVAVFFGLATALALVQSVDAFMGWRTPIVTPVVLSLGIGCIILFLLGLYDDVRGVSAIMKLFAQTVAALVVIYGGQFRIDQITFPPDLSFSLGVASMPVTVLWLIGVSNALNLVDGMDGLAGGVSIIALSVIAGAAIMLGNVEVPWQAFALIGAVLGFLRYNAPPARIFLGDSGSLVIGFLLAILAVKGATRSDGTVNALVPIFALSYPLLDTGMAMIRRFLRGEPLSRADGRHIHHQLRTIGLSDRRSVAIVLIHSSMVGAMGLAVVFAPAQLTLAVACAGIAVLGFIFVYGVKWLQYHEFLEASSSIRSAVRNARTVLRDKILARDLALLFDQAATIHDLQRLLQDRAPAFEFHALAICFDESSLAPLETLSTPAHNSWRLEYPIAPFQLLPGRPAFLVISCLVGQRRSANPERVARILAPAIAKWIDASLGDPAERLDTPISGRRNSRRLRAVGGHASASSAAHG